MQFSLHPDTFCRSKLGFRDVKYPILSGSSVVDLHSSLDLAPSKAQGLLSLDCLFVPRTGWSTGREKLWKHEKNMQVLEYVKINKLSYLTAFSDQCSLLFSPQKLLRLGNKAATTTTKLHGPPRWWLYETKGWRYSNGSITPQCNQLDVMENITPPETLSRSSCPCHSYRPCASVQGQSKYRTRHGYSRSKGGRGIWTRWMQEKDLDLNSEKWRRLWKGRKERTVARVETRDGAGNELDCVKHGLGEGKSDNSRQTPERAGEDSALPSSGSGKSLPASGLKTETMPLKACLRQRTGDGETFDTRTRHWAHCIRNTRRTEGLRGAAMEVSAGWAGGPPSPPNHRALGWDWRKGSDSRPL